MTYYDLGSPQTKIEAQSQRLDPSVHFGIVCASPETGKVYKEAVEADAGNLVFVIDDPEMLPVALQEADTRIDVVLAVASPSEDMASVPRQVHERLGKEVDVILEEVPAISGLVSQSETRRAGVATGFARIIKPFGNDPWGDAVDSVSKAHAVVARRKSW